MNKNTKQKKKNFKKIKSGSKEKKRNKINSGFVNTKTNIYKKPKDQRAVVKKNLQPFFKVQDTLVELT